jgi:hypothetical protein
MHSEHGNDLMLRRVAQTLTVLGLIGCLGTFCLPAAGSWLDGVELPVFFETTTIALPDGGRLTATMPTSRVQRYGTDGRFRTGWFVHANGGGFAVGLTTDGLVAICTFRGRRIFLYDLDGRLLDQKTCHRPPSGFKGLNEHILQPYIIDVGLQPVSPIARPDASLLALLLVPLWHPFVPWLIFAIGCVMWQRITPIRAVRWDRPVRPFRSD